MMLARLLICSQGGSRREVAWARTYRAVSKTRCVYSLVDVTAARGKPARRSLEQVRPAGRDQADGVDSSWSLGPDLCEGVAHALLLTVRPKPFFWKRQLEPRFAGLALAAVS
jgi:hypothetical protein